MNKTKKIFFVSVTAIAMLVIVHICFWISLFAFNRDENGLSASQVAVRSLEEIQKYKKPRDVNVDYDELEKQVRAIDPESRKVICVGDSWTYGIMVGDGENYPSQLQGYLPAYKVINLGKPGMDSSEAQKIIHRFSGYFREHDVIVMLVGMNDLSSDFFTWLHAQHFPRENHFLSLNPWRAIAKLTMVTFGYRFDEMKVKKDEFQKNMEAIIAEIREKGARPLQLTYALPCNTKDRIFDPNDKTERKYLIIDKIKEVGQELGVVTIDFESIFQRTKERNKYFLAMYYPHLNEEGYAIIARYVAQEVQKPGNLGVGKK